MRASIISLALCLIASLPAQGHTLRPIQAHVSGELVDIKDSLPIAEASVYVFLDDSALPGCYDHRDPALTKADGSFVALSCWNSRPKRFVPLLPLTYDRRPKSVTLIVQRAQHPLWLGSLKLTSDQVRSTSEGLDISISRIEVGGMYRGE